MSSTPIQLINSLSENFSLEGEVKNGNIVNGTNVPVGKFLDSKLINSIKMNGNNKNYYNAGGNGKIEILRQHSGHSFKNGDGQGRVSRNNSQDWTFEEQFKPLYWGRGFLRF